MPMTAAMVAQMPQGDRERWLASLPPKAMSLLKHDWAFWARADQLPPEGRWRTWLMLAGRGFGKTRAGAEWVRALAEADGTVRIALVGASLREARAVMVEGESGLLAIAPAWARPRWWPAQGRMVWPNGAQAFIHSAEAPEALRGAQHHWAWCDELAKWPYAQACWDNLQMGLRLGDSPRTMVTTTPRDMALLRRLLAATDTVTTRGRTTDNPFLSDAFITAVTERYAGTRLGRQELDGELLEDLPGALWTRALIERCRRPGLMPPVRVVVAVDPPAGVGHDACGIVVVGLGADGVAQVMEDASAVNLPPEGWAARVAEVADRHQADRVVAEANNGGAMVESVLRAAAPGLSLKLVHASRGKVARAEPVAALYGAGRCVHAGVFCQLEDELCGLVVGGAYHGPGRSPDRADALVWAMTELMLGAPTSLPGLRVL